MSGSVTVSLQLEGFLERVASTNGRVVTSVVLVIGALVVGTLLVPLIVRQVRQLVAKRYLGDQFAEIAGRVNERCPLTTPVRLTRHLLQLTVFLVALLALLTVWNQAWLLTRLSRFFEVTPQTAVRALLTILLVIGVYIGMGLLADTIAGFSQGTSRMTAHQEQIITRISQLGLLIFVGLLSLSVWDINLQGLLVGAGFLGIVVGFAARQTLGSLLAGFVLMFSRPFEIGDWVVVGDEAEGVVTDITIINTRLENFDGEFIVIPNDRVADRPITNRSQKGRLRLRIDVGVDYAADPEHAAAVALDAIHDVADITESPKPDVFPRTFGDSAIVLEMRFWIEQPTPPKRWRAHAEVVRQVKTAFEREGIKIPYPQRELSDRTDTGGFRVQDGTGQPEIESDASPNRDGGDEKRR